MTSTNRRSQLAIMDREQGKYAVDAYLLFLSHGKQHAHDTIKEDKASVLNTDNAHKLLQKMG